jgi:FtsP/CotA-like multicopper oxidase with cupredoxin domain
MQPHLDHHPPDGFPTDPSGLPEAGRPRLLELADGDTLKLRIAPVAKTLGDTTVRMLAYKGSIPGPTLKVRQGSELVVQVENQGDLEATGHWHGLRLEARAGEVVRLWLTNTANTRVFNVNLPGARMKLVGGDSGRVEQQELVDQVLLGPSERAVVDVLVDRPARSWTSCSTSPTPACGWRTATSPSTCRAA